MKGVFIKFVKRVVACGHSGLLIKLVIGRWFFVAATLPVLFDINKYSKSEEPKYFVSKYFISSWNHWMITLLAMWLMNARLGPMQLDKTI
jgi:hypothetical protein